LDNSSALNFITCPTDNKPYTERRKKQQNDQGIAKRQTREQSVLGLMIDYTANLLNSLVGLLIYAGQDSYIEYKGYDNVSPTRKKPRVSPGR
jgi:hypothetical protein